MQNYEHWKNKLASQDLEDFTSNPEAMLWLKIHSITKKDVMDDFVEANKIQLLSKKVEDKAVEIYNQIEEKDIQSWNNLLDKYFRDKNAEQLQALDIEQIKLDLRRIQHFKWGGDQNNSLDKYFVSHYVKAISSLDALNAKLGTEALPIFPTMLLLAGITIGVPSLLNIYSKNTIMYCQQLGKSRVSTSSSRVFRSTSRLLIFLNGISRISLNILRAKDFKQLN